MENPLVSVIINTKNEERHMKKCLDSVFGQNYPKNKIEIIVIDNASKDKTKEMALKYTDRIYDKGPERSAQKNYGVQKSRGDFLLFVDADMILSRNVVSECIEKMGENPEITGLFIKETVLGRRFWSRVRRFERDLYDGTLVDAVRFIRKSAFLEIGGFDENLFACEDWDLTRRLSGKGSFGQVKSVIFHNEAKFSIRNYLAKKEYYIGNMDVYIKKWGKNDPILKKQFGISYRFFGVFFENDKWKVLAKHPFLALGMYYLRFLVGLKFLLKKYRFFYG